MQAVFACNAYVDEQAPWALRKTDPRGWSAVLATLVRLYPRPGIGRSRDATAHRESRLLDAWS
jgi:methionyl-tRNA synthetase